MPSYRILPLLALSVSLAGRAVALQPLRAFVDSSEAHNPDARESRANLDSARAAGDVSLGRQLPSLDVRGTYTRNQYAIVLPLALLEPGSTGTLTLAPFDQFDFSGTVSVPLVDMASFWRIRAARVAADAADQQVQATRLQVESQVVQDYYQLIADLALVSAAQRALDVAKAGQALTLELVSLGRAPPLEQDRAAAEVERSVQQLAQAQLLVAVATQALASASGLAPQVTGAEPQPQDDLHPEAEEASFAPPEAGTPAMQAARLAMRSAELQGQAARLQLIPTLSGSVNEHSGNYVGFSGYENAWTGLLQLTWHFDYASIAAFRLQDAQTAAADARRERVALLTLDAIHDAWAQVRAAIARSRSARIQQAATDHAERLASDRYQAGAATQLDLLQAQRDAFSAAVARIQSDADLANARLQLRLAAGRDPFERGATP
ncbi:MAG TPA: TolC family protein [Myxococcales bacterium]|nr:TolC family protein [Myxococcales bacterium]